MVDRTTRLDARRDTLVEPGAPASVPSQHRVSHAGTASSFRPPKDTRAAAVGSAPAAAPSVTARPAPTATSDSPAQRAQDALASYRALLATRIKTNSHAVTLPHCPEREAVGEGIAHDRATLLSLQNRKKYDWVEGVLTAMGRSMASVVLLGNESVMDEVSRCYDLAATRGAAVLREVFWRLACDPRHYTRETCTIPTQPSAHTDGQRSMEQTGAPTRLRAICHQLAKGLSDPPAERRAVHPCRLWAHHAGGLVLDDARLFELLDPAATTLAQVLEEVGGALALRLRACDMLLDALAAAPPPTDCADAAQWKEQVVETIGQQSQQPALRRHLAAWQQDEEQIAFHLALHWLSRPDFSPMQMALQGAQIISLIRTAPSAVQELFVHAHWDGGGDHLNAALLDTLNKHECCEAAKLWGHYLMLPDATRGLAAARAIVRSIEEQLQAREETESALRQDSTVQTQLALRPRLHRANRQLAAIDLTIYDHARAILTSEATTAATPERGRTTTIAVMSVAVITAGARTQKS